MQTVSWLEPQSLRPVVIFHLVHVHRYNTAEIFPHWAVQRKASRLGIKSRTGEPLLVAWHFICLLRREENPFLFFFSFYDFIILFLSVAKRGKSLFIPFCFLLFYDFLMILLLSIATRGKKHLLGEQLCAAEGSQHAQGTNRDPQAPRYVSLAQRCEQGAGTWPSQPISVDIKACRILKHNKKDSP